MIPIRPTSEQLAPLSPFERLSFELTDFFNTNPTTKAASGLFLRSAGMTWVYYCSRNLVHILGTRHLRELHPPGGLILASNHRSFFDLYAISCWLFRTTRLLKRIYFPVKADFWYETPMGMAISLVMSGLSMYPPVFRQPSKRDFNFYGTKRLIQLLEQPGNVVGIHPEGARNDGPDPYTLRKAQPGVGKLIMGARPTVLPIFINGLCNNFQDQVRGNFDGTGAPVVITVGAPLNLTAFNTRKNNLRTQKELSDYVLEKINELGSVEREYRQSLPPGPAGGPVILP